MKQIVLIVSLFLTAAYTNGQGIKAVKASELEKIIAESKTPLIINIWATWCQPCVEELPYFMDEYSKHKDSLQLILVSLDFAESFPDKISSFARKRKITAPIVWLDETNADYFCPKIDANWSGAIPATLFINNKTGHRKFVEEQLSHEELKKEIMAILKIN